MSNIFEIPIDVKKTFKFILKSEDKNSLKYPFVYKKGDSLMATDNYIAVRWGNCLLEDVPEGAYEIVKEGLLFAADLGAVDVPDVDVLTPEKVISESFEKVPSYYLAKIGFIYPFNKKFFKFMEYLVDVKRQYPCYEMRATEKEPSQGKGIYPIVYIAFCHHGVKSPIWEFWFTGLEDG